MAALTQGQHEISTGVVLGSNGFNLAALLGLGAIVAGRIVLHRRVAARNPDWDRWGVTIADPDRYRLVLASRSWP